MNEEKMSKALDELFEQIKSDGIVDKAFAEIKSVLLEKGKMYGHEVIIATGGAGIVVRLMDKIYRLKNTIIDNPGVADPEDAWLDLFGYAVLGVLFNRGHFEEKTSLEHSGAANFEEVPK